MNPTRPRKRPPWWPADEPWPPVGRPSGAAAIVRRLLFVLFAFFLFATTMSVLTGWLFAQRHGPPPIWGLFWIILIGGILVASWRMTSGFTSPLGNVMAGLDRLAAGDYGARVQPSGPPPIRALGNALNTTAARLSAAEEQRRNLVADIAHEVRTPLAVIRGNVEAMIDGLYPPDPDRLAPILEEVAVITRLVEDLGTLSSAEAGVLQLHPEAMDLAELARELVAMFEPQAARGEVRLRIAAPASAPLEGDEQRLRQVLENLVTNALRHTPAGGEVSVAVTRGEDDVRVAVSDTGSGIAPEDLAWIFERYRKSPDSGGTGLGLAIARRLVEAHGGMIRAESEPGRGTIISFTVPVSPSVR